MFENFNDYGAREAINQQPVQMMQNAPFDTGRTSATLFLFTHRFIPDQYRRPHIYNFNGEFRQAVQENLERSVSGMGYNRIDSLMLDAPSARSAILPSAQGQQMNLKPFCENWTFILILDNDDNITPLGLASSVPSRVIYSGWVTDEPVHVVSDGNYIPNPGAIFSTSHHTTITAHMHYPNPNGFRAIQVNGDFDYINGVVAEQLQTETNPLFDLVPNRVANDITVGEGPGSFNLTGSAITANQRGSVEIPSDYGNPSNHLRSIVNGLSESIKCFDLNSQRDIVNPGENAILNGFVSLGSYGINSIMNGLDPAKPFFMSDLIKKYGNALNINVIKQPYELSYDWVDSGAATRRNVFTSIISTSLPSLLASVGLAEIAFRYNSYVKSPTDFISSNDAPGLFHLIRIATLYASSETEIKIAWDRLQSYLSNLVFPIIKMNGGEFDLTVHCSMAGASLVNLQFLDEPVVGGVVESNNLLSGLATPMVGHMPELQSNAQQLYSVITDTMSDINRVPGMEQTNFAF